MDHEEHHKKMRVVKTSCRKKAVLISIGSFNPVHKAHLQTIDIAAKFLSEKYNIDTFIAYVSPSSDKYVSSKLEKYHIAFNHRYEMLKLACNEHNGQDNVIQINVDNWEGSQSSFVPYSQVRKHFQKEIQQKFPNENLLILYLAGADQFNKYNLYRCKNYVGISRLGYEIKGETIEERNIYICKEKEYEEHFSGISSTEIRNAIANGQSIENLTYKSVIDYLQNVIHFDSNI